MSSATSASHPTPVPRQLDDYDAILEIINRVPNSRRVAARALSGDPIIPSIPMDNETPNEIVSTPDTEIPIQGQDQLAVPSETAQSSQPRLSGKKYVGYSLRLAVVLAIFSLFFISVSIYSVHRSLTDALKPTYNLSILPSVVISGGNCGHLRFVNDGLHFVVNVIGSLIVGISAYLQQICTSPTYQHITNGIRQEGGDVLFGSSLPVALFRRRQTKLIVVWLLLVATSLPIHLALNGAIGYSYTSVLLEVQGVWTESEVANGVTGFVPPWTNITGPECQLFFQQLSINIDVEYIILIVNDNATSTNILDYLPNTSEANPNISFIEYCFTYSITPQCSITLRWAPLLIVTFSLLIKTGLILVCLRFFSHFQQPLFCCIGDLLDLAIQRTPDIVIPQGECLLDNRKTRSGPRYEKTSSGVRARHRKIAWWRMTDT